MFHTSEAYFIEHQVRDRSWITQNNAETTPTVSMTRLLQLSNECVNVNSEQTETKYPLCPLTPLVTANFCETQPAQQTAQRTANILFDTTFK